MPDFSGYAPLTKDHLTWIGRAHALVKESSDIIALAEFSSASNNIQSALRHDAANQITLILYKLLGAAELKAPPSARGTFIPVGSSFDAFAAVSKVLQTAAKDAFIVDPYIDETILTDFAGSLPDGVSLRLLADQSAAKPSLTTAAQRWAHQYGNSKPLAVRLSNPKLLHDRAIFIDRKTTWILTQSLKDFAKRSPAEIVRADDTAAMKIAAYEAIWLNSNVIV